MKSLLPKGILLATDGSKEAASAARVASELAGRSGAELHVGHAWHEALGAYPHQHASWDLVLRAQAELDEQVGKIEASGSRVAGSYLRRGPTVEAILDLAEDVQAGLIVVGSRGLGRMERMMLGSVSEGLVHDANRLVLVVRGDEEPWPPERIIVGDDSFEEVDEAEEFAAELGKLYKARLILVRDYREFTAHTNDSGFLTAQMVGDALTGEEEILNGRGEKLEDLLGSRPEIRGFAGDIAGSVLRVDCEQKKPALVIASSPEPTAGRRRFGSPLDKVMRSARGSFLFYPQNLVGANYPKVTDSAAQMTGDPA